MIKYFPKETMLPQIRKIGRHRYIPSTASAAITAIVAAHPENARYPTAGKNDR